MNNAVRFASDFTDAVARSATVLLRRTIVGTPIYTGGRRLGEARLSTTDWKNSFEEVWSNGKKEFLNITMDNRNRREILDRHEGDSHGISRHVLSFPVSDGSKLVEM